jgi:hypothetical protein
MRLKDSVRLTEGVATAVEQHVLRSSTQHDELLTLLRVRLCPGHQSQHVPPITWETDNVSRRYHACPARF